MCVCVCDAESKANLLNRQTNITQGVTSAGVVNALEVALSNKADAFLDIVSCALASPSVDKTYHSTLLPVNMGGSGLGCDV